MNALEPVIIGVVISVTVAAILGLWKLGTSRRRRELARDKQINRVVDAVIGVSPSDDGTLQGQPGLLEQVRELREGQLRATQISEQAADDVGEIRSELSHNGGSSTKDAVHQAVRSAEAAAAAAEIAAREAGAVKGLMKRHMENGVEIMDVGVHNDQVAQHNFDRLCTALEEHGVEVTDLRHDTQDYPPVDTGD